MTNETLTPKETPEIVNQARNMEKDKAFEALRLVHGVIKGALLSETGRNSANASIMLLNNFIVNAK